MAFQNEVLGLGLLFVEREALVGKLAVIHTTDKDGRIATRIDEEGGIHVKIRIGLTKAVFELFWREKDGMDFSYRKEFHIQKMDAIV